MATLVRFVAPGTKPIHDGLFKEAIDCYTEELKCLVEPNEPAGNVLVMATYINAIAYADRFEEMRPVPSFETLEMLESRLWLELEGEVRSILASWLVKNPYYRAARCLHFELCESREAIEVILGRSHASDNAWHQFLHRTHEEYDLYHDFLRRQNSPPFPSIFRGVIEGIWGKDSKNRQEEKKLRDLASALRWLRAQAA